MCTMSNGQFIADNATIGLLRDSNYVHLTFSPFKTDKGPAEIALISPALKRRDEVTIVKGTCVVLCLKHRFQLVNKS